MATEDEIKKYVKRLIIDLKIAAAHDISSQDSRLGRAVNKGKVSHAEGLEAAASLLANDFGIYVTDAEVQADMYLHIPRPVPVERMKA